jgi:hypothetical protein
MLFLPLLVRPLILDERSSLLLVFQNPDAFHLCPPLIFTDCIDFIFQRSLISASATSFYIIVATKFSHFVTRVSIRHVLAMNMRLLASCRNPSFMSCHFPRFVSHWKH